MIPEDDAHVGRAERGTQGGPLRALGGGAHYLGVRIRGIGLLSRHG